MLKEKIFYGSSVKDIYISLFEKYFSMGFAMANDGVSRNFGMWAVSLECPKILEGI
jgi:hypothetical protein